MTPNEEPIAWSASMIAEPSISFGFGSSLTPSDVPWVLTGDISNGYFYIEFPGDLELSGADEDSVKVARVYIEKENNSCSRLELNKIDGKYEPGIDMFYLVGDTSYTDNNGYTYNLKSGWNFIDEENGKVYYDVYDLLEMGYRWVFYILDCG